MLTLLTLFPRSLILVYYNLHLEVYYVLAYQT
jgi:hypothetical protein